MTINGEFNLLDDLIIFIFPTLFMVPIYLYDIVKRLMKFW